MKIYPQTVHSISWKFLLLTFSYLFRHKCNFSTFARSFYNTVNSFCFIIKIVDDTNHSTKTYVDYLFKLILIRKNSQFSSREVISKYIYISISPILGISGQTWIQCDKAVDKGRPIYETNIGQTGTEARGWIIAGPPMLENFYCRGCVSGRLNDLMLIVAPSPDYTGHPIVSSR